MLASFIDLVQYDNKFGNDFGVLFVKLTRRPAKFTAQLKSGDIIVGEILANGRF
jgi:hypothetical protein